MQISAHSIEDRVKGSSREKVKAILQSKAWQDHSKLHKNAQIQIFESEEMPVEKKEVNIEETAGSRKKTPVFAGCNCGQVFKDGEFEKSQDSSGYISDDENPNNSYGVRGNIVDGSYIEKSSTEYN
jgi:hypothetical protein